MPGVDEVGPVLAVLRTERSIRIESRISQSQEVETLIVHFDEAPEATVRALERPAPAR
jgi:hypothetical protein